MKEPQVPTTIGKNRALANRPVVGQIYETYEYGKFQIMKGNRKPNDLHIKRLTQSFEKNYLFTILVVNEKFKIIDGQHRFLAAQELGLPVRYIVVEGYDLEEVKILNQNSSNWKKEDHLKQFCELGVDAYIKMQQFMDDFPEFGIATAEILLTMNVGGVNNRGSVHKGRGRARNFEEGKLEIPNLKLSYQYAKMVMEYKPFYKGFTRSIFVNALIGLFKNKNYNHKEMIGKLMLQPKVLYNCAEVAQYKLLLEDIYNYRRRGKANLRY